MLRRRAGEVELELLACDRDRDAELQLAVRGLEQLRRLVAAVGERGDPGPDAPLRVGDELAHRSGDLVAAAARAQLRNPPGAEPLRGELSAQVAAPLVRVPHLRHERVQRRLVEQCGRDHDALLGERARVGGHAPRHRSAHVGVVRPRGGEAELRPRDERDVGQMRAAGVGVVEDEDVVGAWVAGDHRGDRRGHRAQVHRNVLGLGDHPAGRIEDRGRAVAALLDVRREGGPDQRRAHLLRDGA